MVFFIESIFSVIVGFLGLLLTCILVFSQKSNKYIIIYLALVLFIVSIRSIVGGFSENDNLMLLDIDFNRLKPLSIIVMPFSYLYFESLFKDRIHSKTKVYLHFLLPILLAIFYAFQNKFKLLEPALFYSIFSFLLISIILFYIIKVSFLFLCFLKNKISISEKHFNLINKWVTFIYIIFIIGSIILIISLYFDFKRGQKGFVNISNIFKNCVLLFLFVKLLISPEILFGYLKLKDRLFGFYKYLIFNDEILSIKEVKTSRLQDYKLNQLINTKVVSYLNEIQQFIISENPFRSPKYTVNNLAENLSMPSSHLAYIFRYHCKMSFVEYKNHHRIEDALKLINEGFLDLKTFESLAKKVGYVSYNPFFTSFKKRTNYSPKEYLKLSV
jgi:AraC-like DNA-binding protein